MDNKFIYIAIAALLSGMTILGFSRSESPDHWSGNSWDQLELNRVFVDRILPRKSFKDLLEFQVDGYYEQGKKGGVTQEFPADWIEDIHENRSSSWSRLYGQPVRRQTLLNASVVDDLIADYPTGWLANYDYVSMNIQVRWGEEVVSLMSESNQLTVEQQSMFKDAELGTQFIIVINYKSANFKTQEVSYERLNVELTLVPEKEAVYPLGYHALVNYFEQNSVAMIENLSDDQLPFMRMQFMIDETGKAVEIHPTLESGIEGLDDQIAELIKGMPQWEAAQDSEGNKVVQSFELVFGKPGC